MKIFDCFQFFDENMILDLRLNTLNQYVDHFVIVENLYMHNGKKKKQNFDIKNFNKFKDKIILFYLMNYQKIYLKFLVLIIMRSTKKFFQTHIKLKRNKETQLSKDLIAPTMMT